MRSILKKQLSLMPSLIRICCAQFKTYGTGWTGNVNPWKARVCVFFRRLCSFRGLVVYLFCYVIYTCVFYFIYYWYILDVIYSQNFKKIQYYFTQFLLVFFLLLSIEHATTSVKFGENIDFYKACPTFYIKLF